MKIGVLGSGQLARMVIEETAKFAFEYRIFSEVAGSPAGQICNDEISVDIKDFSLLQNFIKDCDIITLENEFIDANILKKITASGTTLLPQPSTIELIQDKLHQKNFLKKLGLPLAGFCEINSVDDIRNFIKENGLPVVLKSRTMGYDGKGNYTIYNEEKIDEAYNELIQRGNLYCESFIDFGRELAVQVVRNNRGDKRFYPVVESIQKNHICKIIKATDSFDKKISDEIYNVAGKITDELDYSGVMGIELFQMNDRKILINELAPRVHNSGHYTIEGCYVSQFENHIRAICGMPLGSTRMICKNAVMINILGSRNGIAQLQNTEEILKKENAYIHIYGKKETRVGRKMGHITLTGDNMQELLNDANKFDAILKI